MDKNTLHVRWKILFCVLLFAMMTPAVALAELPENVPGNGASESDEINFLTINPADIRVNAEELQVPGVLVITKKEYEKNYQNMLENLGFGGVILDAGDRAIAESGMKDKGKELANKYDPAKPDAGNFFDQTSGIEDTLVGSWFDPSVDSTGNLIASLTDSLNPTSAKGTGGTDISSKDDGSSVELCYSDYHTEFENQKHTPNDVCYIIEFTPEGDFKNYEYAVSVITEVLTNSDKNPGDKKKTQAPVDDGSGTNAGDPNTAGYSISGVYIEQKDNLDQVANDGGASNKLNKKFKWLIDASKQPGFFNPSGGGYEPGDAGLGRDVGIVTYDRTRLPNVNTEQKIPWYLQPMALPKDMGYASEVAAASEGDSRTYEFSGENMMASPEAMGGLKAGDAVKTNVASGGPVRP